MILPILTSPSYLNVLTLLSNCPNVYFALCCSTRKAIVTLIVRKWSGVVTMFMMRFWQLKSSSHHSFLPQNFWSERAQSQNEFSHFPIPLLFTFIMSFGNSHLYGIGNFLFGISNVVAISWSWIMRLLIAIFRDPWN